jgi:hypothetical protein
MRPYVWKSVIMCESRTVSEIAHIVLGTISNGVAVHVAARSGMIRRRTRYAAGRGVSTGTTQGQYASGA